MTRRKNYKIYLDVCFDAILKFTSENNLKIQYQQIEYLRSKYDIMSDNNVAIVDFNRVLNSINSPKLDRIMTKINNKYL